MPQDRPTRPDRQDGDQDDWFIQLVRICFLILAVAMPVLIFLLFMSGPVLGGALVHMLILTAAFLGFIWLVLSLSSERLAGRAPEQKPVPEAERPAAIGQVMQVEESVEHDGVRLYRGELKGDPDEVYSRLKGSMPEGALALLQEDPELDAAILVVPKRQIRQAEKKPARPWLNLLLLIITFGTTTWAGARLAGIDLLQDPSQFPVGIPYAVSLMAILGGHELGHYVVARRYGMSVTPPFFIPVPFWLGTLGAFIQMRSPSEHRRSLFDTGIAGPLAGLAISIVALVAGLQTSEILPRTEVGPIPAIGQNPLASTTLFVLICRTILGPRIHGDVVLQLSPLAFAGWVGLIVTAFNLLPVGQLDGGHVSRGMFGDRVGTRVSRTIMYAFMLGTVLFAPHLLIWALFVFFIGSAGHTPPLNDLTPLGPRRWWLGALTFAAMGLILLPWPTTLGSAPLIYLPQP